MYHVIWHFAMETRPIPKIALLRVISTMKKICCQSFWHLIWKFYGIYTSSDILFCNSDILSGILSRIYYRILSGIRSDILFDFFLALHLTCHSGILTGIYSDSLSDMRAAGPQPRALDLSGRCPLRSGTRGLSPAVPTEVWSLQLKSGSATWDLEFAVWVLECTRLRSGCPTRVWSSQSRSTG